MDRFLAELAIAWSLAVIGKTYRWSTVRALLAGVMAVALGLGLVSCGDRPAGKNVRPSGANAPLVGNVSEVSPPNALQELRPFLETYQPQIKILSPRPGEVLKDERVTVRIQVKDLPIYKDKALGLGPHLHVILDNRPYQAVYDLEQPLIFEDLAPGTHTIRAIASRPWHETFKNDGAFALVTFHVLAKTSENQPLPGQPLLTYSRPTGTYGAEPVMLDFYLTNVPLHLIAQERPDDSIQDWRIRATVNGESFIFNEWQPIYLKGLKPGKNWLQLELLNEDGEAIANAFNNTVRVITYQPGGTDTLSKLVRGELTATDARSIVDPNYVPEPLTPSPTPSPAPSPTPSPTPSPEVSPEVSPEISPSILPTPTTPAILPPSPTLTLPTPAVPPIPVPEASPEKLAPTPSVPTATPDTSNLPAPVKSRPRSSDKSTIQVERSPDLTDEKASDEKASDQEALEDTNLISAPSPQTNPAPTVDSQTRKQVERSRNPKSPKPNVITPVEPNLPLVPTPPLEAPQEELPPILTEPNEPETVSQPASPAPPSSTAVPKSQKVTGRTYLDRLRQQFTSSKAAFQNRPSPNPSPSPSPDSPENPTAVPTTEDSSSPFENPSLE